MASYPSSIYSPRTKANRSGVVYDAAKTTVLFAEDVVKDDDEIVAVETELGTNPKGAKADVKTRLDDVDTAIAGKISAVVEDTTPELGGDLDTLQKSVHIANVPDDHIGSGIKTNQTTGETLGLFNVCYRKSDGKAWQAKADAVATAPVFCLALEASVAGAGKKMLLLGIVRDDSWDWTPGGLLYLSPFTAGAMTQTQPSGTDQVIQVLGIALTATRILFRPSQDYITHT